MAALTAEVTVTLKSTLAVAALSRIQELSNPQNDLQRGETPWLRIAAIHDLANAALAKVTIQEPEKKRRGRRPSKIPPDS